MERFEEIRELIVNICAVDREAVTKEAHLNFDLGADSLAVWTLAAAISDRYGIELSAEDIVETENIGELLSLVDSKIEQ